MGLFSQGYIRQAVGTSADSITANLSEDSEGIILERYTIRILCERLSLSETKTWLEKLHNRALMDDKDFENQR